MPGPADVSGKPKANNVYAQKVVVKQAPRVSTVCRGSCLMAKVLCLTSVLVLCRVTWLTNCRMYRNSDFYNQTHPESQTHLVTQYRSGRHTCSLCHLTPYAKHSCSISCLSSCLISCLSSCSSRHGSQMTNQMTGTGHNQALVLVSRHLKSPLSRQQPLSQLRTDPQTVPSLLDQDRHHLLSDYPLRFKIRTAVTSQHPPDRELHQDLRESPMRLLRPSEQRTCLGR